MKDLPNYGLFEVFTQEWLDKKPIKVIAKEAAIIQSIQDHLSRLLNARQGVLSHLPDYGLPDITQAYADLPYTIGDLQVAIGECIKRYEPRIKDVVVVSMPDDRAKGIVIFEIQATLQNGRKATFETYFKSEGDAKVEQKKENKSMFYKNAEQ
jgi:type VI secretion system protein